MIPLQPVSPRFAATVLNGPGLSSGARNHAFSWANANGVHDLFIHLAPEEQQDLAHFLDPNGVLHVKLSPYGSPEPVEMIRPDRRDTMRLSNAKEFKGLVDVLRNVLQQTESKGSFALAELPKRRRAMTNALLFDLLKMLREFGANPEQATEVTALQSIFPLIHGVETPVLAPETASETVETTAPPVAVKPSAP